VTEFVLTFDSDNIPQLHQRR